VGEHLVTAPRYRTSGDVPSPVSLPETAGTCWAAQRAVLRRFMETERDPAAARDVLEALGLARPRPQPNPQSDDPAMLEARSQLLWHPDGATGAISRPSHHGQIH
jgi:hypothetical protein